MRFPSGSRRSKTGPCDGLPDLRDLDARALEPVPRGDDVLHPERRLGLAGAGLAPFGRMERQRAGAGAERRPVIALDLGLEAEGVAVEGTARSMLRTYRTISASFTA
jgi:hypothetical protein